MPDTGFLIAGDGTEAAFGSEPWVNPINITADDATSASANPAFDESTTYLVSGLHGVSLSGATVIGIEVQVDISLHVNSSAEMGVTKDLGTEVSPTTFALSSGVQTVGGPTELWGFSWSEAEVESALFGAAMYVFADGGAGSSTVDAIWVKVYYSGGDEPGNAAVTRVLGRR